MKREGVFLKKQGSLLRLEAVPDCSRRAVLKNMALLLAGGFSGSFAGGLSGPAFAQNRSAHPAGSDYSKTYGLSSFGELALPPDFPYFAYVNPDAPKGGRLILKLNQGGGNQNYQTFNTLNIYIAKGDGAAGMHLPFDTLMIGHADEPDSLYGLLAHSVLISADQLTYKFLLRPEARFHDGSALTARDVAFSIQLLKEKGHYIYRQILRDVVSAEADEEHVFTVRLAPERSRDLHLSVASMPVFSKDYWKDRNFEAVTLDPPLGSGPYRPKRFEPGSYIEFERVSDYWAQDLPVQRGMNNFDLIRYEYYRSHAAAFEAFRTGRITYWEEETANIWATGYDFPARQAEKVRQEALPNTGAVPVQGWHFNLRLKKFRDIRIRKAITLCFDFEWVNRNVLFSSFRRLSSYFQNTSMAAEGLPSSEELRLLEPFRNILSEEVFLEAVMPPVSDGSGHDRNLMKQAIQLLQEVGCRKNGKNLLLPDGEPFTIEFLDYQDSLKAPLQILLANLNILGIGATSRTVDASQYQARLHNYDFDMTNRIFGNVLTPGDFLKNIYGSAGLVQKGSYNIGGISHPAIDALLDHIALAQNRTELHIACRALDRVLRAGCYMVPLWFKDAYWLAYWRNLHHPEKKPAYASGAPFSWWYEPDET